MNNRERITCIITGALLALILLYAARDASGATIVGSTPAVQAWTAGVQAHIHVPGPAGPAITVQFKSLPAGECGEWRKELATVVLAPGCRTPDILEHELGHAFDTRNLDAMEQAWLTPKEGFAAGTPWENPARWRDLNGDGQPDDPYCQHTACPSEVFADLYMGCAFGYVPIDDHGHYMRHGYMTPWWGSYPRLTTVQRYAEVCQAIRAFADPVGA